jgi:site-specific DNA-methyltransferase (adenine-specific)
MIKLHNSDCIIKMQEMINDGIQVDSVVTDPPYELGFMGKSWDSTGIAFQPDTWKLAYQLLKPGGHLLAFSGSRTYHRMAVAIEDAGFEIRDQIMWLYGSGFPKSLNIGKAIDKKLGNKRKVVGQNQDIIKKQAKDLREGKRKILDSFKAGEPNRNHGFKTVSADITKGNSEWEGWGTALKPAHEPVVMARKPLSEKSIVDNVLKHGTGGINIDASRIEGDVKHPESNPDFRDQGKKSKEAIGIDKLSFGQVTGAKRKKTQRKPRSKEGVWTEDNSGMKAAGSEFADADPRGRFPANVMHDGSDAVQEIFPNTSKSTGGGGTKTISKNKGVFTGGWGDKEYDKTIGFGDEGSAARFFYCPKVSKNERNRGVEDFTSKQMATKRARLLHHDKGVAMKKNTHPTVKPVELMKYLCRMVTPKGGIVLDPFMGSGSTGIAAKDEGFDFIGIEMEEEYFNIASSRIGSSSPLMDFM